MLAATHFLPLSLRRAPSRTRDGSPARGWRAGTATAPRIWQRPLTDCAPLQRKRKEASLQTFVINLDRSTERLADFYRINPHLKNISRFRAVDGRTIDRTKLVERGIFEENVKYTDGAVGNALSHLRLWNHSINLREPITVAEDDAIIHRNFESLTAQVIAELPPDWHIIFWGWNFDACAIFDFLPGLSMLLGCMTAKNIPSSREAFQSMPLRPTPYRLLCCFGIPCYSISPEGAARLTSLAVPIRHFTMAIPGFGEVSNSSIDIVVISLCKKINAYASFPPLVLTANDPSISTVLNP